MKEYLKGGRSVVRDKALAIELGVYLFSRGKSCLCGGASPFIVTGDRRICLRFAPAPAPAPTPTPTPTGAYSPRCR